MYHIVDIGSLEEETNLKKLAVLILLEGAAQVAGRRKDHKGVAKLWILNNILLICLARYSHCCHSGTTVFRLTKYFLIGLEALSLRRNMYLVL